MDLVAFSVVNKPVAKSELPTGRVARGDYSPQAPTDPDVRN